MFVRYVFIEYFGNLMHISDTCKIFQYTQLIFLRILRVTLDVLMLHPYGVSYLPVLEFEFRNCFWVHGPLPKRQWAVAYRVLATAGKAMGSGLRVSATAHRLSSSGETQFSELKLSFWTQTQKQVYRIHIQMMLSQTCPDAGILETNSAIHQSGGSLATGRFPKTAVQNGLRRPFSHWRYMDVFPFTGIIPGRNGQKLWTVKPADWWIAL